jgi:hypothetical protein
LKNKPLHGDQPVFDKSRGLLRKAAA